MPAALLPRVRTSPLRVAIWAGFVLYLLLVAKVVTGSTGPDGFHAPLIAFALLVTPFALWAFFKAPIVFPFGLYVALIPFDPLLSVVSGATLVRFLGMAAALALVVRLLLTRNVLKMRGPWYFWFAWIVWAATTLLWTDAMVDSKRIFPVYLQNFLMMTVLAVYPVTRREFKTIATTLVLSGVGSVIYAIYVNGGFNGTIRMSLMNAAGSVVDQNFFATSFMLPIAFAFSTALSTRRTLLRLLCWVAIGLMLVGILISGSRGAFVALALMFGYFALRGRSLGQVALLTLGLGALLIRFPLVWQRLLQNDGGSGRTFIWGVGLQALKDHWLFGSGVGSFQETYARAFLSSYQPINQGWTRPAHNVVLGVLVELGILGFVLLAAAWLSTFRSMRVIRRSSPNFAFRTACEAGIIALVVQSFFIDPMWLKYVWLGFTLPFMLLNLESRSVTPVAARRDVDVVVGAAA